MNNPKPQEWKSEELSQGRIMDYKAFNFVDGEESVALYMLVAVCFTARAATMLQPGLLKLGFPIPRSLKTAF